MLSFLLWLLKSTATWTDVCLTWDWDATGPLFLVWSIMLSACCRCDWLWGMLVLFEMVCFKDWASCGVYWLAFFWWCFIEPPAPVTEALLDEPGPPLCDSWFSCVELLSTLWLDWFVEESLKNPYVDVWLKLLWLLKLWRLALCAWPAESFWACCDFCFFWGIAKPWDVLPSWLYYGLRSPWITFTLFRSPPPTRALLEECSLEARRLARLVSARLFFLIGTPWRWFWLLLDEL